MSLTPPPKHEHLSYRRANWPLLKAQLDKIGKDSKPQWGELTPPRLFRHLHYTIQVSLSEVPVPDKSTWFTRGIGRKLFFEWFTNWPKAKIKAPPNYTPTDVQELELERARLYAGVERFIDELEKNPRRQTVSELLGTLPLDYWAHVHGLHTNHHLKQYGLGRKLPLPS